MFRDMTLTTKRDEAKTWAACREAVALGLSIKEAAEKYGLSYSNARQRAAREEWATPRRMSQAQTLTPPAAPSQVVAASWQERGEAHRRTVMSIVERALGAANIAPPENWADLERAARIGDRAAGLEKQAPAITLAFPIATSSQESPFYEADTVFADTIPHLTPAPLDP